jgi:acyl carrier protein
MPMVDVEPLRAFLRSHFRLAKRVRLEEDQKLFPDVIDAFGVIEVADFVEEAYGIRFDQDDLLAYEETFASLASVVALIERRARADSD